ncbi:MAG: TadE family protein, partial [Candidatus Omnitrophota bacterium]
MRKRAGGGFVLILVIFIMMVFGILGWTLAVMQAGNLGSAARNLQDRQALYLAESGAHWGLYNRISTGAAISSDSDCLDANDWVTHTIAPGQYKVCTRPAQASEAADIVVESIGYVPSAANYISSRQIKITANLGSFDKAIMASGVFDWVGADQYRSYVAGDMMCMYYESNGNNVYNETGIDYSGVYPCRPRTNRTSRAARRDVGIGELPEIDMKSYELDSNVTVLAPCNTTTISDVAQVGGNTQITVSTPNFFGSQPADRGKMVKQVVRDISLGSWESGTW